ncbi:ester cyclase [Cryptosporangium phraense]|uniref:Ester cyclase n=1 Tax=Cryptosporangium phraense TaxID=2593070 RepID=A0A545AKX2_9ACTN|nr:ester cyclase [Cryptosporangium phraense]TQS41963.1 ester cyclase [Cryptosporangium phraense]
MRAHYLDYIAALNARRFDDLGAYVADRLTYNERPLTLAEYRALLVEDVRRIPDLHYDVRQLVVEGETVASRIRFACTPREPFHGLEPTGRPVVFDEHVFYRFASGRIAEVWSLLDLDGLRRQLAAR